MLKLLSLNLTFHGGEGLCRGVLCSVNLALQQSAASLFFSSAINIKYINLAAFNNVLFNLYIYTGRLYRINLIMKLWQTNIMTDTLQPAPECHIVTGPHLTFRSSPQCVCTNCQPLIGCQRKCRCKSYTNVIAGKMIGHCQSPGLTLTSPGLGQPQREPGLGAY